MKFSALAAIVACVPALVRAAGSGNPFEGATPYLIPDYTDEVNAAVAKYALFTNRFAELTTNTFLDDCSISDSSLASQAALVAQIPVFFWMDVAAKVPTLGDYLTAAESAGGTPLVQAVIYDLPDRDCAAEASAGEYTIADGGAEKYQAYIDAIAEQVEREFRHLLWKTLSPLTYEPFSWLEHPNVRVVFVVEPDGLANLVTNLSVAKCANAESTYKVPSNP